MTLAVVALGGIAWLTLRSYRPDPWFIPRCCIPSDILLNVLLFVPLGLGLGLLGLGWKRAGALGLVLSTGIELTQLFVLAGRDPTVHDVVSNTGGSVLGALLVTGWPSRGTWWGRIGPLLSASVVAVWVAAAYLVRPGVPSGEVWYSQWQHSFHGAPRYPGRVVGFTLQGEPVPNGRLPDGAIRRLLARADTVLLVLSVVSAEPEPSRVQLAGLVEDGRGEFFCNILVRGRSLLIAQRLGMDRLDLRAPRLRLDSVMPEGAGDTVTISLRMTRSRIEVTAVSGSNQARREIRLSPELVLTALIPFEYEHSGPLSGWEALLVFAGFLLLGLGLCRWRWAVALGTALCLLGPLASGSALPLWPIWAIAAGGAAAGLLAASGLGLSGTRQG